MKTGVAVFLTTVICDLLGWPPVFAVITAIVTVEPTVSDSIKKGIIRFPASAIGSAYAVLFISLFGNSALTYTLATVLTITTCYKLNLHAGLLVATLTSVAMVEVIHDHFLVSFFIRLGTTTVGLGVSTIVNMFVLPPDYLDNISKHVLQIATRTGSTIETLFEHILFNRNITGKKQEMLWKLEKDTLKTETLIRFQQEESKYHPLAKSEKQEFHHAQQQLTCLRQVHYRLENLLYTPLRDISWSNEEKKLIMLGVYELVDALQNRNTFDAKMHHKKQRELMNIFWEDNEEITRSNHHPTKFPPELVILYELLSIGELVEKYFEYQKKGKTAR